MYIYIYITIIIMLVVIIIIITEGVVTSNLTRTHVAGVEEFAPHST